MLTAVSLPAELYLLHVRGTPLGPLPRKTIEVLYDSRVVDEGTPVSKDGTDFRPLGDFEHLMSHLEEIKERLGRGEDPWTGDLDSTSRPDAPADAPLLRVLLDTAVQRASGRMLLTGEDGQVLITLKDGKVVALQVTIEELSLERYLEDRSVCDAGALEAAKANAPNVGGDLGAALIAAGAVQPHEWFDHLVAWAKDALGGALMRTFAAREFQPGEVPAPAVPLGFDRLGLPFEIVRQLDLDILTARLERERNSPVIPSQVEGIALEDTKPRPRELRVLNAVDGVQTVSELVSSFGGTQDQNRAVWHTLFFAAEVGFIVLAEDPLLKKEREEAVVLEERYEKMRESHYFEILDVNERNSDEEVRTRYTDLAKEYHPDTLRQDAAPELLAARRKLFALIGEAFEGLETEDQRYAYAHDLDQGRVGGTNDLQKVQDVLHSETLFKKAEILVRVKKYDEALAHLEEAIRLNEADAEFRTFKSYVEYLVAAKEGERIVPAEKAIKEIQAALREQENIASAYLALGHLYRAVEKHQLSLRNFEKVLEYDEHHPEATRHIRMARSRQAQEQKKKKKRWLP